jgi:hypothetical protein
MLRHGLALVGPEPAICSLAPAPLLLLVRCSTRRVGATPGSKLEEAEWLGVPVIDEAGLLELVLG